MSGTLAILGFGPDRERIIVASVADNRHIFDPRFE
jgi:hypothetical protein